MKKKTITSGPWNLHENATSFHINEQFNLEAGNFNPHSGLPLKSIHFLCIQKCILTEEFFLSLIEFSTEPII